METKNTILLNKILGHMDTKAQGHSHGSILLKGDPGIGKTSFINFLARFLGLEVIVIEVPHISEEHLINIPFIVFNPLSFAEKTGNTQLTQVGKSTEYKLVLSQSNLYSQIKLAREVPDSVYLQNIYKSPKTVIATFEHFGGSKDKIPESIALARKNYNVVLFLDEYFRSTTPAIRNILRSLLNNRIGMHDLPTNAYLIYASNMVDAGIEDISLNNQFHAIRMPNPDKEEWFDWLEAKFEADQHVKLNKKVIDHFRKILETEDLSHEDIDKEVRTSPRRWEQLLLYINSSIPVKDEEEAKNLMTNVKANFYHYKSHEHSSLAPKVLDAVAKLIKQTSKMDVSSSTTNETHEWRNTLLHQIQQKMKLGEHRKYIPTISGLPGIGKTQHMAIVAAAKDLDLRFIHIDVSTLRPEDIIGLPIPGKEEEGEMTTQFSKPKLLQEIMDQIHKADKKYIANIKKEEGANANQKIQEYENRRWKYLILFDELNRPPDVRTFNALRRVLLEKNFGPSGDESGELIKLPEESIIVAAINPEDINTIDLTHHVRDALDVVHAAASWKDLLDLLKQKNIKGVSDLAKKITLDVMNTFANKFKTKDAKYASYMRPYHLDVGIDFYVSPREYTDMYTTMSYRVAKKLDLVHQLDPTKDAAKLAEADREIREIIFDSIWETIDFGFDKHKAEGDEFMHNLKAWILKSKDIDIGEGVIYKKAETSDIGTILGQYLEGKNLEGITENQHVINYMNNVNIQQFIEQLSTMLSDRIKDEKGVKKYILDKKSTKKAIKNKQIVDGSGKVSLLENFLLALMYNLHLQQFTNEQIHGSWRAMSKALNTVLGNIKAKGGLGDEVVDEMDEVGLKLRSDVHDAIGAL